MENILKNWRKFRVFFTPPIFFMADYDGTLTPIAKRPEDAVMSQEMKKLLSDLTSVCPVGIISGRSLKDLKSMVDLPRAYYSGNHGFEISGPSVDFVLDEAKEAKKSVQKICKNLEDRVGSFDGVIVENKTYTASVHYRLVEESEKIDRIIETVEGLLAPYREKNVIEVKYGKKVIEIGPKIDWDKGKAVSLLLKVINLEEETMPIYLGDDITDEDAFHTLKNNGISILVSEEERETAADYRLKNHQEVKKLIKKIAKIHK